MPPEPSHRSPDAAADAQDAQSDPNWPADAKSGLSFGVASSLDQVSEAWQMVYKCYLDAELIKPNKHRIHTAPYAVGSHSVVAIGQISELIVSTLTVMVDPPTGIGLPLDRVYPTMLDQLRKQGRRLMEVGLFADRRRKLARSAEALLQLMRYAFYFGLEQRVTDFVIGVHPRHARFYVRSFGFEPFGEPRVYHAVNDRPVQLLRGDLEDRLAQDPLHPALEYFVENPLPNDAFKDRYHLTADNLANSPIEEFLHDEKQAQQALKPGLSQAG